VGRPAGAMASAALDGGRPDGARLLLCSTRWRNIEECRRWADLRRALSPCLELLQATAVGQGREEVDGTTTMVARGQLLLCGARSSSAALFHPPPPLLVAVAGHELLFPLPSPVLAPNDHGGAGVACDGQRRRRHNEPLVMEDAVELGPWRTRWRRSSSVLLK
jgi:hypothetical protein